MRYGVYQIKINAFSPANVRDAYMDAMMGRVALGLAENLYVKVAEIEATGLDDVFDIGNIGPEENITRIGRMSSVSVGNIIEDADGKRFVVAGVGFEEIV